MYACVLPIPGTSSAADVSKNSLSIYTHICIYMYTSIYLSIYTYL